MLHMHFYNVEQQDTRLRAILRHIALGNLIAILYNDIRQSVPEASLCHFQN